MASRDEVSAAREVAYRAARQETGAALRNWLSHPRQLAPWVAISALIAAILLVATLVIGNVAHADPSRGGQLIAADPRTRFADMTFVSGRNLTVLLLHLMVCLATYLARRSLPLQAEEMSGMNRAVHHHAAGPALIVVAGLTLYSIGQQAYILGHALADASSVLGMSPDAVLLRLLPHAVPELIAVFLPLAAALWLQREDRAHDLLAATVACAIIGVPVVLASAWIEVAVASHYF
ncbi:hypothetical protein SK069_14370 [Patulibacter brassicae]|uniref:Stage II sporulation protein M n=1 Tax=Patulibacter brassicae TaxID=1705717 RepID=A0ABU4VLR1_9ACTN|nr:hypothetical protein [Patulibacter brassicae]MDX8152784.1 hypothetical protein [Patulibacter brassicae]